MEQPAETAVSERDRRFDEAATDVLRISEELSQRLARDSGDTVIGSDDEG
ncbi:hypothetical protein [Nocardia sp. NPDC058666]